MKYPEIEKLGLQTYKLENPYAIVAYMRADMFVRADNLEKLLREATTVYGILQPSGNLDGFANERDAYDTHTAKLIGISAIKREALKKEVYAFVRSDGILDVYFGGFQNKKVRLVIEEVE